MRTHRSFSFLALLAAFCLLSVACGSTTDLATNTGEGEPAEAEPVEAQDVDLVQISEQDLEQARLVFDAAKAQWLSLEPFSYTLNAGVDSINMIEIDFDADGNASPERVISGEADPQGWAMVPRSVDAAFDDVESLIAGFENGEFAVPARDECGNHFNIEFDPEYGNPVYYNSLGPCDDGVGVRLQVAPAG